jgi:hypothetical protein
MTAPKFTCAFCSESFTSKLRFAAHIARVHFGILSALAKEHGLSVPEPPAGYS